MTQQNWDLSQVGLRSKLLCSVASNPSNNQSYPLLHIGYFLFLPRALQVPFISPIFQTGKLKLKELKESAQGHSRT